MSHDSLGCVIAISLDIHTKLLWVPQPVCGVLGALTMMPSQCLSPLKVFLLWCWVHFSLVSSVLHARVLLVVGLDAELCGAGIHCLLQQRLRLLSKVIYFLPLQQACLTQRLQVSIELGI